MPLAAASPTTFGCNDDISTILNDPVAAEQQTVSSFLISQLLLLRILTTMIKTNILAALLCLPSTAAFAPASSLRSTPTTTCLAGKGGSSADLGIPCEDECALECFPNLPDSVHPGVLSGQAQVDLLRHAKENGE